MSYSAFELQHFPYLCEIEHRIPTMPLDQLTQMIEADQRFINEVKLAYFTQTELGDEFDQLRKNIAKSLTAHLAGYAANNSEFIFYLFRTDSRSEAIYPLRIIISHLKGHKAAKIFRHYGTLDAQTKQWWLNTLWDENPGHFQGWKDRLLEKNWSDQNQKVKRHRNIVLLCEVEGTADFIVDFICAHYFPCHLGFKTTRTTKKRFNEDKGLSLTTLIHIASKWPKLAYKIINAMLKSSKNKSALQILTLKLMTATKDNHANSILTLINLKFFEALFNSEINLDEILALCNQFKIYGNSLLYYKQLKFIAEILSGLPLPQKHLDCCLEGLEEQGNVILRLEEAYALYQVVLSECDDEVMKAQIRVQLNDTHYRFQMAEHFHRKGSLGKALEFYKDILKDGLNSTATLSTFVLSAGIPSRQTNEHINQFRSRTETAITEGKEALLRIALLCVERLNQLNLNPSVDSSLLFEIAEKFICKGRFADAHRLLSSLPADVPLYQASQNKMQLLEPHKKEWKPGTPLISRTDIIEYVLPHFQIASAAGLEDATKAVQELSEELRLLQNNQAAGFKRTFVGNIGDLTKSDTEHTAEQPRQHSEYGRQIRSMVN